MVIDLPDIGLSEQEVKQELGVALFQQNKASLAKAVRIAGMTRLDLQRLLASRQIAVHYTVQDWEDDQH
jgi:predicted HTH domain antitoxin